MGKARSTTQNEQIQIAKESLTSGKNYVEATLEYNIRYQQVRTWRLRFKQMGEAGLQDRRGRRKKN